jgi:hypothetical protein
MDTPVSIHRSRSRRGHRALFAAMLTVGVLTPLVTPTPAQAALADVGPVDPAHGYPLWFEDSAGLRLELCLDGPPMCLEGLPNPNLPPSVGNLPDESFWWAAEATMDLPGGGTALLVLAQEAAWLNEVPEAGQNMAFSRVRIRVTGLTPGASYTVTHPYGEQTFTAQDAVRNINATEDIGCAAAPCDFGQALTGSVGPFLTWPAGSNPPAGFVGDPGVEHTVVGSPTGNNFFRITGPGLGAGGVQTNLFAVQGKLATGAQPTPDLLGVADTGRSGSDNVTRVARPTFTGFVDPDQAGQTVEILVDGTVKGTAAATGTSYRVKTSRLTQGRHAVRARIQGSDVRSNVLSLTIDRAAPRVTNLNSTPKPFNMNRARFARFSYHVNEAAQARAAILRGGKVVKSLPARRLARAGNIVHTWNGTNKRNRLVAAGRYGFRVTVSDAAGNRRVAKTAIRVSR